MIDTLTVADDVLRAIDAGHVTFAAIRQHTGRTPDRISEALAYLLLTARSIRTQRDANGRARYFPSSATSVNKGASPRRALGPALSFSSLTFLMPDRPTGPAICEKKSSKESVLKG